MKPLERNSVKNIERLPNSEGRFNCLRLDKNEHLDMVSGHFLGEYKKLLTPEIISIYPEVMDIKRAIANYAGISRDLIVLSHGSDASIKQVFEVFAREKSDVVLLKPTYAMYGIYATITGANIKWIDCDDRFIVDEKRFIDAIDKKVSIVAVPNPNSPTGSEFSRGFLLKCLKKCQRSGVLLLIDEAYFPFSKTTMVRYVEKEENLVVTRTFSKAFGLGGCRAGFMAVSPNLIRLVQKARPMYEINALSALAIKVCMQNSAEAGRYAKRVREGRDYIVKACRELGLTPYPTNTNFINIRLPEKFNAGKLEDFGKMNGVLFKGKLGAGCFKNCIRITLGPKRHMVKFTGLLKLFIKDNDER